MTKIFKIKETFDAFSELFFQTNFDFYSPFIMMIQLNVIH